MRGGWRSHGEGSALSIHLVVNQTPLLQKRMNPGHKEYFVPFYLFYCVAAVKLPPQMEICKQTGSTSHVVLKIRTPTDYG